MSKRYRVMVRLDEISDLEDLKGDMFNPKVNDDIPVAELVRQEREFERTVEAEGVWGYEIQERCSLCQSWTHVDSCWGFVGYDFAEETGKETLAHLENERQQSHRGR